MLEQQRPWTTSASLHAPNRSALQSRESSRPTSRGRWWGDSSDLLPPTSRLPVPARHVAAENVHTKHKRFVKPIYVPTGDEPTADHEEPADEYVTFVQDPFRYLDTTPSSTSNRPVTCPGGLKQRRKPLQKQSAVLKALKPSSLKGHLADFPPSVSSDAGSEAGSAAVDIDMNGEGAFGPRPSTVKSVKSFRDLASRGSTRKGRCAVGGHDRTGGVRISSPQRLRAPPGLESPRVHVPATSRPQTSNRTLGGNTESEPLRVAAYSPQLQGPSMSLRDYYMLAEACRRGRRWREEAQCMYNMGVIHDNAGTFSKAIPCFNRYLALCQQLGDRVGEALALNCLGVNHQYLAEEELCAQAGTETTNPMRMLKPVVLTKSSRYHLERAAYFHQRHLAVADVPGKFIGNCNLGMICARLSDFERAQECHRQALRCAILMSNVEGESVACGNLAIAGLLNGDPVTAKACLERHVKLANMLSDTSIRGDAYLQLADLASQEAQYEEASAFYEQAREIARDAGRQHAENVARVKLGIAQANVRMESAFKDALKQLCPNADESDEYTCPTL
eukprot:Rmarinus@m.736